MEATWVTSASINVIVVLALMWAWKVLNWLWVRPKRIERLLREQGLQGNPYKLVVGDVWEMVKMGNEAESKPMNLSDDIVPRVSSFFYNTINKYGMQILPTHSYYLQLSPIFLFVHVSQ